MLVATSAAENATTISVELMERLRYRSTDGGVDCGTSLNSESGSRFNSELLRAAWLRAVQEEEQKHPDVDGALAGTMLHSGAAEGHEGHGAVKGLEGEDWSATSIAAKFGAKLRSRVKGKGKGKQKGKGKGKGQLEKRSSGEIAASGGAGAGDDDDEAIGDGDVDGRRADDAGASLSPTAEDTAAAMR